MTGVCSMYVPRRALPQLMCFVAATPSLSHHARLRKLCARADCAGCVAIRFETLEDR